MQVILAWVAVVLVLIAPYPTTVWLLKHSPLPTSRWFALIVSLGLGIGALTWIMMLEGMLGIPFRFLSIVLPYLVSALPGLLLWWRNRTTQSASNTQTPSTPIAAWGRFVVIVVGAAVVFNAVYWPFYKSDAVGIYADQAHTMYATGRLIPLADPSHSYYQAYPMLVQLSYTFTYLASGWENVYLAKLIPALLSLACLGAAFYLGKMLYDEKTGWLAALLLAFTPLFGRWASSGYADLPMAFYYTLTALFAWRTWQANHSVDALLSGLMIGLGAWTKNAILPATAFWFAFLALGVLWRRIHLKGVIIACAACTLVAGPWYARNLLEAHMLIPATAWTDQAAPNLSNLLVYITHPENFGFGGWLILIGTGWALVTLIRQPRSVEREILLLIFTLPYFAFWWLLASYDRRFLLYFLPILTVLAAGYMLKLWEYLPQKYQRSMGWMLTVIALGTTVYIVSISIDYKTAILRNPLMTDAAKHQVVTGQNSEP